MYICIGILALDNTERSVSFTTNSRLLNRSKGARVNELVTTLRAQIAMKDFEIKRRKEVIASKLSSSKGGGSHSHKHASALLQIEAQIKELKELEAKYIRLTGRSHYIQRSESSFRMMDEYELRKNEVYV
jgi:hypothetical protein